MPQTNQPKRDDPKYQYNKAQYHPVEEYLVTSAEKLTSATPGWVLEVTWPRVAIFYHPSSALCIQLRDRYVAVAREIRRKSIRTPVEFWAVSCEVHRDACEELGVSAVPKILAFRASEIEGLVVPRTDNNEIEVDKVTKILGIDLQNNHEDELKEEELLQKDREKLLEIEKRAQDEKGPNQMIKVESDHLQEILHPHTDHSDVYADAMASLFLSIDDTTRKVGDGLTWSRKEHRIFREWIDLLHWSLPTRNMAKAHNIINDLRNNIAVIREKPDEITDILETHNFYSEGADWSKSCNDKNRADKGYACGFWKLLHIISIGVYSQHRQVLGDLERVAVPHIVKTIHDYVKVFGFAANNVEQELLVESLGNCTKDEKCQRKIGLKRTGLFSEFFTRTIPQTDDKSWKELSIFLWEIHQTYRRATLNEALQELQWPSAVACPKCFSKKRVTDVQNTNLEQIDDSIIVDSFNQIIWNKEPLFTYLKHEYWPRALQTPRVVVLDQWDRKHIADTLNGGNTQLLDILKVSLLIVGCAICLSTFRKMNFRKPKRRYQRFRDDADSHRIWLDKPSSHLYSQAQPRRRVKGRGQRFRIASRPFLDD
mmetsp:Transcript_9045/g.14073  ORF Transcript_9045/g.14073 Transcript_9045/m.14073 type:complete len:597 (+) Transcript_9045:60-1850(+)